jgi:hypothetical protein
MECALKLYTAESQPLEFTVSAAPTESVYVSEEWIVPKHQSDILLVVDNSDSMLHYQHQAHTFVSTLLQYIVPGVHRVGITTTNPDDHMLLIHESPPNGFKLSDELPTSQTPYERGFESAWRALSSESWLRPNASLQIIMLSDEPDQSAGLSSDYLALYSALKGPLPSSYFRLHAIAPTTAECQASTDLIGTPYESMVLSTDGILSDLCTFQKTKLAQSIMFTTLAPGPLVHLGATPISDQAIDVHVDSTTCSSTWKWDALSGSAYAPIEECLLQQGDSVRINYALCQQ